MKTKQEILGAMRATIEKLKNLQPNKFYFGAFVTEWDDEHKCGTICCIGGYYPLWFPEVGLKYDNGAIVTAAGGCASIKETLINFHGLTESAIKAMFYPIEYHNAPSAIISTLKLPTLSRNSTLSAVIELWEMIYGQIEATPSRYDGWEVPGFDIQKMKAQAIISKMLILEPETF